MEAIALELERRLRDSIVGDGVLAPPYKSAVCDNIRAGLRLLGLRVPAGQEYDDELRDRVREFQQKYHHRNTDGLFGPGTRRLLAQKLAAVSGEHALALLRPLDHGGLKAPLVFLSYAWADSSAVDRIDQWLRDHGIRVHRDTRDFNPGQQLPDAIRDAIVQADKVIAVYSSHSRSRDWPRFELALAEQQEHAKNAPDLLIYLVLDDTPLPQHDPNRIAVTASGKTVRQIGEQLLRGILNTKGESPRIDFDENAPLSA